MKKDKYYWKELNDAFSYICRTTEVLATKQEFKKRNELCNECEFKKPKLSVHVCTECNCVLEIKQRLKHTQCPLKKW
jgi:hypothetical protein